MARQQLCKGCFRDACGGSERIDAAASCIGALLVPDGLPDALEVGMLEQLPCTGPLLPGGDAVIDEVPQLGVSHLLKGMRANALQNAQQIINFTAHPSDMIAEAPNTQDNISRRSSLSTS